MAQISRDSVDFFFENKLGMKGGKVNLPSIEAWNTMLWSGSIGLCQLDELLTTLDALRRFTKKYMEYELDGVKVK